MRVVKHNGRDKQCVSGMSAPFSMIACFSVLSILCHLIWHKRFVVTWMEIPWHNNLQGRAWRKMWRKVRRKVQQNSAAKSAAKNVAKNAVKTSTAEKQLFRIYHDCFHFGPGTLLATRFLDPFPRRSGSVAGSPSAQCNPLLKVMLNLAVCIPWHHPTYYKSEENSKIVKNSKILHRPSSAGQPEANINAEIGSDCNYAILVR